MIKEDVEIFVDDLRKVMEDLNILTKQDLLSNNETRKTIPGYEQFLLNLSNCQIQDILEELGMLENGNCLYTAEEIFKAGIEYAINKGFKNYNTNLKECIAWLEKQGYEPNWCHHKVDLSNCSEEYRKAYYDGWNNCNLQHSQCKSEGNDVVKCLINGMKFYYEVNKEATWGTEKFSMKVKDILSWLEKQNSITKLSEEEQNRFCKGVLSGCAMSFIDYLDAHKYEGKMCVSNGECEDIENAFHNAMWDRLHRYYCKYIEEQGEVKESVISQHENKTCKENDDSLTSEDEKLTEFEKAIYQYICITVNACDGNVYGDKELKLIVKGIAKELLDLARKELQPEFDKELDKAYKTADNVQYQKGKQDALKDLPKWKKAPENMEFDKHVHVLLFEDEDRVVLTTELYKDEYYIELDDLKTLPKEE